MEWFIFMLFVLAVAAFSRFPEGLIRRGSQTPSQKASRGTDGNTRSSDTLLQNTTSRLSETRNRADVEDHAVQSKVAAIFPTNDWVREAANQAFRSTRFSEAELDRTLRRLHSGVRHPKYSIQLPFGHEKWQLTSEALFHTIALSLWDEGQSELGLALLKATLSPELRTAAQERQLVVESGRRIQAMGFESESLMKEDVRSICLQFKAMYRRVAVVCHNPWRASVISWLPLERVPDPENLVLTSALELNDRGFDAIIAIDMDSITYNDEESSRTRLQAIIQSARWDLYFCWAGEPSPLLNEFALSVLKG